MFTEDRSRNAVESNNSPFVHIVRIHQVNSTHISGMGLLFSDRYVLTCSHVVTCILNKDDKVDLYFPYSNFTDKLTAKKLWSNPENGIHGDVVYEQGTPRIRRGEDIAILEIEEPDKIPEEIKGFQLIETKEINYGDIIRIKGYPQGKAPDITVQGTIESSPTEQRWIQINGIPYQRRVQEGYSGSPVWNQRLQKFIGITIAIYNPDDNNGQATTSFMIPNSILKEFVPKHYHLFEDPPPPPQYNYQYIIDQLRGSGLVIPFIGPRINFDFYQTLEAELSSKVGRRILGNQWNGSKRELIKQLIGIPWPECPYLINERPGGDQQQPLCPVIKGLTYNYPELEHEQDLSVIKRNIRYLSLYYKMCLEAFNTHNDSSVGNFYNGFANLFTENNDHSSKFYEFLAKLCQSRQMFRFSPLPFNLIITSNFDDKLTRKFDEFGVPYDLVFYVADGSEKGKFKHKYSEFGEIKLIDTQDYNEFKIGERPIILQLYGRWDNRLTNQSINMFRNNFFVIDEMQFHGLLNNLKNLPDSIRKIIQENHILFVGHHSNDYELQMIMQQIYISNPSTNSWLITHDELHRDLNYSLRLAESIWKNFNTEIKPIPQNIEEFAYTLITLIPEMLSH